LSSVVARSEDNWIATVASTSGVSVFNSADGRQRLITSSILPNSNTILVINLLNWFNGILTLLIAPCNLGIRGTLSLSTKIVSLIVFAMFIQDITGLPNAARGIRDNPALTIAVVAFIIVEVL
jgi:hypothetical protein